MAAKSMMLNSDGLTPEEINVLRQIGDPEA